MRWLNAPQEWSAIPPEKQRPRGVLKAQLDKIAEAGAEGRPFLLKYGPVSDRGRLMNQTRNYRYDYGKAGFSFEVRPLPSNAQQAVEIRETHGEDAVGLWTVWTPIGNRQAGDYA